MRRSPALLPLALLAAAACGMPSPAPPTAAARKSVELADMDRKVDPCVDFYEYANGGWRAQNPIPPSMDRWSRRWQAGEENKKHLREILEEVSQRRDWPPHGVEQQIGDFYASCMDEKAVDAAGATPLAPLLAEIAAVQDARGVEAMIGRLHAQNVPVPFWIGATVDQHEPSRTIADVGASGLGMPDRDYYFKTEPRFVEARDKYRAYVARVFGLLGSTDAEARAAAEVVMAFETRLAAASLDNVARRDPKKQDHIVPFAELGRAVPHFDWARYFDEAHLSRADLNVDEPAFLAAVDHELADTPVAAWRTYLTWQLAASAAPWLSRPRPETQRTMVQGDPHPVARFRVLGPPSNLPAFRLAFACSATSPMVRPAEKRCEVW